MVETHTAENGSAVYAVAATLQRVYGDATQTVLDRRAAQEALETLRSLGWMSLEEVAVLIEAAGGSITVPDKLLIDGRNRVVHRQEDWGSSRGLRFTTRVTSPERTVP